MGLITVKNANGGLECMVNTDAIASVIPSSSSEDVLTIKTLDGDTVNVNKGRFEAALAGQDSPLREFRSKIDRLIQALDRMTIHFPTSIRMHM